MYWKGEDMINVNFYDTVDDERLKFAVIVSRHDNKWVFCKHKERDTYECPGGHREAGETVIETARRELWEETGAVEYDIFPVCVYSVEESGAESFGMLYYADILKLGKLPGLEIEKIELLSDLPENWTYPGIQSKLLEKAVQAYNIK